MHLMIQGGRQGEVNWLLALLPLLLCFHLFRPRSAYWRGQACGTPWFGVLQPKGRQRLCRCGVHVPAPTAAPVPSPLLPWLLLPAARAVPLLQVDAAVALINRLLQPDDEEMNVHKQLQVRHCTATPLFFWNDFFQFQWVSKGLFERGLC